MAWTTMRCSICDSTEPHPPHYTEGPTVDELIAFLRAALDRDEQVALAATAGTWHVAGVTELGSADVHAGRSAVTSAYAEPCCSIDDAEHIARWDPARVLAEVQAKRRILAMLVGPTGEVIGAFVSDGFRIPAERFVKLLAQPYAGQPGWREEWAL